MLEILSGFQEVLMHFRGKLLTVFNSQGASPTGHWLKFQKYRDKTWKDIIIITFPNCAYMITVAVATSSVDIVQNLSQVFHSIQTFHWGLVPVGTLFRDSIMHHSPIWILHFAIAEQHSDIYDMWEYEGVGECLLVVTQRISFHVCWDWWQIWVTSV